MIYNTFALVASFFKESMVYNSTYRSMNHENASLALPNARTKIHHCFILAYLTFIHYYAHLHFEILFKIYRKKSFFTKARGHLLFTGADILNMHKVDYVQHVFYGTVYT